jgi:hypothetical protein
MLESLKKKKETEQ